MTPNMMAEWKTEEPLAVMTPLLSALMEVPGLSAVEIGTIRFALIVAETHLQSEVLKAEARALYRRIAGHPMPVRL